MSRRLMLWPGRAVACRVTEETKGGSSVGILWVVIIVILVLALLGFFGRGRFYG